MTADAAIVVVTYNSAPVLPRCLAALLAQSHGGFEVVVFDNASTDGSAELAERWLTDPRFRVVRSAQNLGFAAANNRAVAMTTAPWIVTLNADAWPEPDWLAALLVAPLRWPGVDMFGSTQIDGNDPSRLDGAGDVYHATGFPWRGAHGRPLADEPPEGETFSPCAAAAMYRRSVFDAAGGFDERYFCYCEDIDLAFRLRLAGHRCVQLSSARVVHQGGGSSGASDAFRVYHGMRNALWTFVKNMPIGLLLLMAPAHILLHARLCFGARAAHLRPVHRRALVDAVLGIGPILRQRRAVQGAKVLGMWQVARLLCWRPMALRTRPAIRL